MKTQLYFDKMDCPEILSGIWYKLPHSNTRSEILVDISDLEDKLDGDFNLVSSYASIGRADYSTNVKPILDAGYLVNYFLELGAGEATGSLDPILQAFQTQSGIYWTRLNQVFDNIAQDGRSHKIFLSIFHECNGNGWAPWQVFYGNNDAAKLKQAYRLVVELARSKGLQCKFVLVFNPQNSGGYLPFRDMYPGDNYVDFIGLSDYNRAAINANSYQQWRHPGMMLRPAYKQFTGMSRRPIFITELGCAPSVGGNSRAQWVRDYVALLSSGEFDRVKAVTFFMEDKSAVGSGDWVLSSPQELDALSDTLKAFKNKVNRAFSSKVTGKNLLPGITSSLTGWAAVGATTSVQLSTETPYWADGNERSIMFSKLAHTVDTNIPFSHNFYFRPADYSFYTVGKTYTLSFWAKASIDRAQVGVGIRNHQTPFEIYADYSIELSTQWQRYEIQIATGVPIPTGPRLPWFALGLCPDAVNIWVAGVKLENGFISTAYNGI